MPRALVLLLCWLAPAMAQPARVLLDTDSGFFADDGQALVLLLRSPEKAAVEAITVVSGNVWAPQGVEYTLHILKLLGRPDVPLYEGAHLPLVHTPALADAQAERWGKLEFRGAFATPLPTTRAMLLPPYGEKFSGLTARPERAVDVLIDAIERNPGKLTILAIGPMTNLAMALRLRPGIASKIRQLVFMGGNVSVPGNASLAAEFNFWFDPEAASVMLRSAIPRKVMFGLDICNKAVFTRKEFDAVAAARTPVTELFREDAGNRYPGFLKDPKAIGYMWDVLAAAWLIKPGFVTESTSMYLDVETTFGPRYGATIPLDRRLAPGATPVEVMLDLNFPTVFSLYKDLMTR
ncbi:MAG TPA: nucleoside hydrolase [Bryobacteraceae bacterium]|nr:nucleoside hydrolase [Bryobacteraceae bacterium]